MTQPDHIKKDPSKRTPWILLEPGRIFIMGRSIPENAGDFYRPLLKWISEYVVEYSGKTVIDFGFEYINTSSTKWIYAMLRELSAMKDVKKNASVKWYYENGDDDMCELGFILRSLINCPFIVVEVPRMNRDRYNDILSNENHRS